MEYIINLLKELIKATFLLVVLYTITPRFIKNIIKFTFRATKQTSDLTIKLVIKGFTTCLELYQDNTVNKLEDVKTLKKASGHSNSNVISFPNKMAKSKTK